MLYHAGVPGFGGGYVGVDVFFVISGYLITSQLFAERQGGGVDLVRFYARRARRLAPAGQLVLIATAGLSLLPMAARHPDLRPAAIAAAGYVSNLHFIAAAADYFDASLERNPVLHTWSLGVEEQFYLFWPLVIAYGPRSRRGAGLVIAGLIAASLGLAVLLMRTDAQLVFFGLPTRLWELACGALVALLPPLAMRPLMRGGAAAAGLLVIAWSVFAFDSATPFPGLAALAPVAAAALVIAAEAEAGPLARLLACGPAQVLGRLSYSWYLWHWPLISLFALEGGIWRRLVLALAALAAAAVTYRLVERPALRSRLFAGRPGLTLACTLCSAALAMMVIGLAVPAAQR